VNLPNIITIGRLFICIVLFFLLSILPQKDPSKFLIWTVFALFVIAAGTDFLDGYIARKLKQVTRFGRIADPFVDKILVLGTMIFLCSRPGTQDILKPWMVVVITGREFLISALRSICEAEGIAFPAQNLGKYKMTVQCIAIGFLIGNIAGVGIAKGIIVDLIVWAALVLTIISVIPYIIKASKVIDK